MDQAQLFDQMNLPQQEAILTTEGPLLVLAGAGTGKTRVITHRIAYLLSRGVKPDQILAITFTNKAAQEMKERLDQLVGAAAQGLWVGTFHAMMARILRRHAQYLGYTPRFTIADTDDQTRILRTVYRQFQIDEKLYPIPAVRQAISASKNQLKTAARATYTQPRYHEIHVAYEQALKQADAMDFDDLLLNAVRLFDEQPELLNHYQEAFRYLLVDEYQDTNPAQFAVIERLARKHRNLCVVGDDDQSIYSFRGADIRIILSFEKTYPEAKVIKLEQNYRCCGHILQAANHLIAQNQNRKAKRLWTDGAKGERIQLFTFQSASQEGYKLVSMIQHLVRHQGYRYQDMAVLYRVNALSRGIEQALRQHQIPFQIVGGLRFYDRKEIKDVLAYLRLIANPADELAFQRIVNYPRRGIGEVTIQAIRAEAERTGEDLLSVCRQAKARLGSAKGKALQAFAELMDAMRAQFYQATSLAEAVDFVCTFSGLREELMKVQAKEADSVEARDARLANLGELITDAQEFEQHVEEPLQEGVPRVMGLLYAFLDHVYLASATNEDQTDNQVSLISIHSAKGLEFPVVFIIGLEEGIFPTWRALTEGGPAALEEERRLAYVALTRAKKLLVLTTAGERMLYGRPQLMKPSQFIEQLPSENLHFFRQPEFGGTRDRGEAESSEARLRRQAREQEDWRASRWAPRGLEGGLPGSAIRQAGSGFYGGATSSRAAQARLGAPGERTYAGGYRPPESPQQPAPADGGLTRDAVVEGLKVIHPRFGKGVIQSITPAGSDAILVVQFEDTRRNLMFKQARLTRDEEE